MKNDSRHTKKKPSHTLVCIRVGGRSVVWIKEDYSSAPSSSAFVRR